MDLGDGRPSLKRKKKVRSKKKQKNKKSKSSKIVCVNCKMREPYPNYGELLCRPCIKLLPADTCQFCRKTYHVLSNYLEEQKTTCKKCYFNLSIYGDPTECQHCKQKSAFDGRHCERCKIYMSVYGDPIECQECSLMCAFQKEEEKLKKVQNRYLCYTCTVQYKRNQKKLQKKRLSEELKAKDSELSLKKKKNQEGMPGMPPPSPTTLFIAQGGKPDEEFRWRDLVQKFDKLEKAFEKHKKDTDKQIQDYVRKIFTKRTEADILKEQKEIMQQKALEMEQQVTAMQEENEQIEETCLKQMQDLSREREIAVSAATVEMDALEKQLEHYKSLSKANDIVDELDNLQNEADQDLDDQGDFDADDLGLLDDADDGDIPDDTGFSQ